MNTIHSFSSYMNPWSSEFNTIQDFKKITSKLEIAKIIIPTILATTFSCGVFTTYVFRKLTEKSLTTNKVSAIAEKKFNIPLELTNARKERGKSFLQTIISVYTKHRRTKYPTSVQSALSLLRHDIKQKSSDFNGELSLSIFTKTPLLPVLEKTIASLPQPNQTQDLFDETRRQTVAQGIPGSEKSLIYMFKHPKLLWNSFSGTSIGRKFLGKILPFDPKHAGKNISGFLFQEQIGKQTLDWTAGPSPTLGEHLSPEATRAIEFLPESLYSKWIYVNLQSLGSVDERGRSLALLEESRSHPKTFCTASISVDSPLYRGKIKTASWQEQKKLLLDHLSQAIFKNNTTEYFFSLSEEKKEAWWNIVNKTLNETDSLVEQSKKDKTRIFHELAVLGLIRAWQAFNMPKEGKAFSTTACKECIDRGGSVNSAFYWAFLGDEIDEKTRAQKVMSILWGRPLLAKNRLIIKDRTKGFEALVTNLSPKIVREYLKNVWDIADQSNA